MQVICSHDGAIQWMAMIVKIQSTKRTLFSIELSCAYERCRAGVRACLVVVGTSCVSNRSQSVIINIRSLLIKEPFVKNTREIPENAEKEVAMPTHSWPLHGVLGL